MVDLLLEHGAMLQNLHDYNYETPLKLACKNQDGEMVHYLLDHKVKRRHSAFDLLEGDLAQEIGERFFFFCFFFQFTSFFF